MEYEKLQKIADHIKGRISTREDADQYHKGSIYGVPSREQMDSLTTCEGCEVNFNFRNQYVDVIGVNNVEQKMIQDLVFEERIRK